MYYLAFAIFFALNFSLWFILPALILKNTIKPTRKKKDKDLKNDLIIYIVLTIVYIITYLIFYRYYFIAINNIEVLENSKIGYFGNNINALAIVLIIFSIVAIIYNCFTFVLAKKTFYLKKINLGYIFCSLTGFFNIITYWFSNAILKLNLYSFPADKFLLNSILKINYDIIIFIFPILVFIKFALSFIEQD